MTLFEAVEKDDLSAVERLLLETANGVRTRKEYTGTPLHVARSGAMVDLLLRHGADIHSPGWLGATPLHTAAERGDLAVVEALLRAGADPSARTEHGFIPLHQAGSAAVVEVLTATGAREVDVREGTDRTPLHFAAQHGRVDVIQKLLKLGATVDARSNWGQTPLHWAAQEGHVEVVRALLEAGAFVNAVALAFGNTPLHTAAARGQRAVVELLLSAGADAGLRNRAGQVPYHTARSRGAAEVAARLWKETPPEVLGIGATAKRTPLREAAFRTLRIAPEGDRAVSSAGEGRLAAWKLSDPPRVTHWIQTLHFDIRDLVFHPHEGTVALAVEEGGVEIRRWKDLSVTATHSLPGGSGAVALDYAPDGHFLAVAGRDEQIHLLDSSTGTVLASAEAPEWAACIRFSPDGKWLAAACSWQGGGKVELYRVAGRGSLAPFREWTRSNIYTPVADAVDELVHLAFTADGKGLALFETTGLEAGKPPGWRGNVVLLDPASGAVRWKVPVAAELTGDRRPLSTSGDSAGFFTQVAPARVEVLCGASRGAVLALDLETGKLTRRLQLPTRADVIGLAADPTRSIFWALTAKGLHLVNENDE